VHKFWSLGLFVLFSSSVWAQPYDISGTMFANDGSSTSPLVSDGAVTAFDTAGNEIASTPVDINGVWTLSLADGDYIFYFDPYRPGTYEDYVTELQDGSACVDLACFGFGFARPITPLTISGTTNGVDATLEIGVVFQGSLSISAENSPAAGS
jgi:hypothetical protein